MTLPNQELHVMMDAAHDLSITIGISHNRHSKVEHALHTNVTKRGELVHDPARYMTRSMSVSDAK